MKFLFPNTIKPVTIKCKEYVLCCFSLYLWVLTILRVIKWDLCLAPLEVLILVALCT